MPDDRRPKTALNRAQVEAVGIRTRRRDRGVIVVILKGDGGLDVGAACLEGLGAAPLIDLYDTIAKRVAELEGRAPDPGAKRGSD